MGCCCDCLSVNWVSSGCALWAQGLSGTGEVFGDHTAGMGCCDVCRIHSSVSAARSAHLLIASGLCSRLGRLRHPPILTETPTQQREQKCCGVLPALSSFALHRLPSSTPGSPGHTAGGLEELCFFSGKELLLFAQLLSSLHSHAGNVYTVMAAGPWAYSEG